MNALQLTPASFNSGVQPLAAPLDALASAAVQPGEVILLQCNTNRDEAILVTTARLIVLKGPSKRESVAKAGRFFPLDDLLHIAVRRGIFGGHIALITTETTQEPQPFDMSRCSFAVSFRNLALLNDVAGYLEHVVDAVGQSRILQIASGPLTPVSAPGIMVRQGEAFYYARPATLFAKHTYRTYQGGTSGFSFRVLPGVYYRIGGMRGTSVPQSVIEPDDHGLLAMSNQRLLFIGQTKNIDIPNQRITGVAPFADGLQVSVATGKTFQFATGETLGGVMLQRLCTNPP